MKRAREMHGMEIVIAPEHLAHPLGGPALHLGAELLPVELQIRQRLITVVDL